MTFFFFSSRRRHTRFSRDWSSDVCSSDLVYLDYMQNGAGKTIAAPYAVRPRPGAPVSTPLRWSEVDGRLDPARFTIRTVPARARRLRVDPLLPVLSLAPDLLAAVARLRGLLRTGAAPAAPRGS